jgi:hypothetical protein
MPPIQPLPRCARKPGLPSARRREVTVASPAGPRGSPPPISRQRHGPSSRGTVSRAREQVPQIEALDRLAAPAEELCVEMPFETGQNQPMNQPVTCHGRTACQDGAGGRRNLLRIRLASPLSRARPAGHAGRWGDVRAGARRGGAMPGRSAVLV